MGSGGPSTSNFFTAFDTVINKYLIDHGGLDIHGGEVIGYAVETQCRFRRAFAFPETIVAGLRVGHLGRRSVRYEVGLFSDGRDQASAEGYFVHVFVDRSSEQAVPIPEALRQALTSLAVG